MQVYSKICQNSKYDIYSVPLYICENGERKRVPNVEIDLISFNLIDATTRDVISSDHPEWAGYKISVAFDYGEVKGTNGFIPKGEFPLFKRWSIPVPQALLTSEKVIEAEQYQVDFMIAASPALKGSDYIRKSLSVGSFHYCYMKSGWCGYEGLLVALVWCIIGFHYDDVLTFPKGMDPPNLRQYFDFVDCLTRALKGEEEPGDEEKVENFLPDANSLLPMCRKYREFCIARATYPGQEQYALKRLILFLEVTVYEYHGWCGTEGKPPFPNVNSYMAMRLDSIASRVCEESFFLDTNVQLPDDFREDPLYLYWSALLCELFTMQHDAHSIKKEIQKGEKDTNYFLIRMQTEGKTIQEVWDEGINVVIPGKMREIEEATKKLRVRWGNVVDFEAIMKGKYDCPDTNVRFGFLSIRYTGGGCSATGLTLTKP